MHKSSHKLYPFFLFALFIFIFVPKTAFAQAQWYQSSGVDMRNDKVFLDPLPAGQFASLPGLGGMPGVIFGPPPFLDFGAGSASDAVQNWNWQVEDILPNNKLIQTSYKFLNATLTASGSIPIAVANLTSLPGPGNYIASGNTTIDMPIALGGGIYIILIDGNLTIEKNITVPLGSIAIFSASGNIMVESSADQVEGLYSADNNFTTETNGGIDNQLIINGSVIVNAGRSGGIFENKRTLGLGNSINPSVEFNERPDFILNYPGILKHANRFWQELAP